MCGAALKAGLDLEVFTLTASTGPHMARYTHDLMEGRIEAAKWGIVKGIALGGRPSPLCFRPDPISSSDQE
jgi:hypothetical protein